MKLTSFQGNMQMPREGHMPNKDALFPDYFPRVSLIVLTNC